MRNVLGSVFAIATVLVQSTYAQISATVESSPATTAAPPSSVCTSNDIGNIDGHFAAPGNWSLNGLAGAAIAWSPAVGVDGDSGVVAITVHSIIEGDRAWIKNEASHPAVISANTTGYMSVYVLFDGGNNVGDLGACYLIIKACTQMRHFLLVGGFGVWLPYTATFTGDGVCQSIEVDVLCLSNVSPVTIYLDNLTYGTEQCYLAPVTPPTIDAPSSSTQVLGAFPSHHPIFPIPTNPGPVLQQHTAWYLDGCFAPVLDTQYLVGIAVAPLISVCSTYCTTMTNSETTPHTPVVYAGFYNEVCYCATSMEAFQITQSFTTAENEIDHCASTCQLSEGIKCNGVVTIGITTLTKMLSIAFK